MNRTSLMLAAALVLLPLLGAVHGARPGDCKPGDVFESEDVRLWFHGLKGFVKVFDADASREGEEGGKGPRYSYTTGELVEVDAEGARVAWMSLEQAYPKTGECTLEDSGDALHLTFSVTDDVRAPGGTVGEATVVFSYHFNKSSQGAKFDVEAASWPWRDAEAGTLAYSFDLHAPGATLEPAENGVGMRGEDGTSRGYVEWAPNATVTYPDAHQEVSVVESETAVDGETARVTLRFTGVAAGYERLDYDPWAGIGEYVVVGGRLVGLAPVQDLVLSPARDLLGAA